MEEATVKRASENLLKVALMSADELAAKKGESDLFVQIKRNAEKLDHCAQHIFESQPDWRANFKLNDTVHCLNCGGDMKRSRAMDYLKGYAHGAGISFDRLCEKIWPK